jgi:hypothetical protein
VWPVEGRRLPGRPTLPVLTSQTETRATSRGHIAPAPSGGPIGEPSSAVRGPRRPRQSQKHRWCCLLMLMLLLLMLLLFLLFLFLFLLLTQKGEEKREAGGCSFGSRRSCAPQVGKQTNCSEGCPHHIGTACAPRIEQACRRTVRKPSSHTARPLFFLDCVRCVHNSFGVRTQPPPAAARSSAQSSQVGLELAGEASRRHRRRRRRNRRAHTQTTRNSWPFHGSVRFPNSARANNTLTMEVSHFIIILTFARNFAENLLPTILAPM